MHRVWVQREMSLCEIMFILGVSWSLRSLFEIEWVQTVLYAAAQIQKVFFESKFQRSVAGRVDEDTGDEDTNK